MSTFDSPIQNRIISLLKNADKLRYRDLQPEGVSNDLFNYHLQHLVKKRLVEKSGYGYSLAEKGVARVADKIPSGYDPHETHLFKYNIITVLSREITMQGGAIGIEILNQERTSHPSYGKVGVMGGNVRKGESVEDAATRVLKAETGLEAQFKIVAFERRRLYKRGVLFSDYLFPIAYARSHTGELKEETSFGRNFWAGIDTAIQNESAPYDSIQALPKVLSAVKSGTIDTMPFFFQECAQDDAVK